MKTKKSTRIARIALLLGTLVSLYFVPWILVKAWITPLPNTIQEQVDDAIGLGFDGLVVYIDEKGKEPAHYTAGYKDRDLKIPADHTSLFKIASIRKLYDVVALTKLVHTGRLSLDKSIADYLPELEGRIENATHINLRNLVQHRSGIPNYTDTPNYWSEAPPSYQGKLDLILDQPANFIPDKDYEYCNTNYLLLDKIMELELGYQLWQFISDNILKPLKLNDTYASIATVDMDQVMSGYHKGYPHDLKSIEHGMLTTAEDVSIFIRALNDGSVFDDGEADIYASLYKYEHSGWVPGYQSFAEYHEDIDAVIIYFYSTTDQKLLLWNLSEIINSRIVKILNNIH